MQTSYLLGVCYTYLAGGGWLANSKYNMILKVIPLFPQAKLCTGHGIWFFVDVVCMYVVHLLCYKNKTCKSSSRWSSSLLLRVSFKYSCSCWVFFQGSRSWTHSFSSITGGQRCRGLGTLWCYSRNLSWLTSPSNTFSSRRTIILGIQVRGG